MIPIEWLLVIWICKGEACHYERVGHYATHEQCMKAARHAPWFKCVMQREVGT